MARRRYESVKVSFEYTDSWFRVPERWILLPKFSGGQTEKLCASLAFSLNTVGLGLVRPYLIFDKIPILSTPPPVLHSLTVLHNQTVMCFYATHGAWSMLHICHTHTKHTHKQTHGNVSDWLSCIHTLIGEDIDFLRVMCAAVSVHSPLGFSWYFSMSLSLYFIIYFIVQDINACVCCVFVLYPSMILLWTYERQIMHLSNTHHFNSPYLYSVCSMILFYSSSFYQWCSQVPLHSSHPKVPMLRYMYIFFFYSIFG